MLIYDQFGIMQNLQTSTIPQISFLVGTFFDSSYNKTALVPFLGSGFTKRQGTSSDQVFVRPSHY